MNKRHTKKHVFYLTIFLFVLTGLHYVGWLRPVERLLATSIAPASTLVYEWETRIAQYNLPFSNADAFVSAYYDLEQKALLTQQYQAKISLLEEENTELKRQLAFRSRSNIGTIGAEVIGKTIDSLSNTILINRGENDGVNVGDPIIVGDGILAGVVARTDYDSAVVRLIKDRQSKIAAAIVNDDRTIGLIEGGYGLSVRMNFIPQNERIKTGDTVVTSGLEEKIPRGLIIGTIEAYEQETYQPFQQAVITPAVNLDRITVVSIITSS